MKKYVKSLIVFTTVILVICSILSNFIYNQMTVTVTKSSSFQKVYNQAIYFDDGGSYVYMFDEKESWNGTVYQARKAYIQIDEVGKTQSTLLNQLYGEYIVNSSKAFSENSFVKLATKTETIKDTYIVFLKDEFLKLEDEYAKSIFYENEVKLKFSTNLEEDVEKVVSLNEWDKFLDSLPKLGLCLSLICLCIIFSLIFYFKTIKQKKNSIKYIILSGAFLVALFFVLNSVNLPSSLLPVDNFFDIQHYIELYEIISVIH